MPTRHFDINFSSLRLFSRQVIAVTALRSGNFMQPEDAASQGHRLVLQGVDMRRSPPFSPATLRLSLESVLALLKRLLGLGQLLGWRTLLALAKSNLLLQLGYSFLNPVLERLKHGLCLFHGLFL